MEGVAGPWPIRYPLATLKIHSFTGGEVETNAYLVADETSRTAFVVDAPHGLGEEIVARARHEQLTITHLINTHGHWDHIADNAVIVRLAGARLLLHRADAKLVKHPDLMADFGLFFEIEPTQPDGFLDEGDEFRLGALRFEVRHCPGHCPGSIVLYEPRARVALVGDVIFAGSVGRADLPGGNWDQLMDSIRSKILTLPDDVRLLPGHGPATTVGRERRTNPFLS